jgi:hypothetical protein
MKHDRIMCPKESFIALIQQMKTQLSAVMHTATFDVAKVQETNKVVMNDLDDVNNTRYISRAKPDKGELP